MKLNKIFILTLLIFTLFICGCSDTNFIINEPNTIYSKYEYLKIKDINYNKEEQLLSFNVENNSKYILTTSLFYNIEKYSQNNEWVNTNLTDTLTFIEIALTIKPHSILQEKIDLSTIPDLSDGYYRIVKQYYNNENYINGYVQFNVNKNHYSNFIGYNQ